MDTYKHGFVVKSQKELEEDDGSHQQGDGWYNHEDKWADSFISDMGSTSEARSLGDPL